MTIPKEYRELAEDIENLPERERAILIAYLGLDGEKPRTYQSLGDEYNVTRERVRQVKDQAIKHLVQLRLQRHQAKANERWGELERQVLGMAYPDMEVLHALPLEELELLVRTYHGLKRIGIYTIGDLMKHTDDELMSIPNFGKVCLSDTHRAIEQAMGAIASNGA